MRPPMRSWCAAVSAMRSCSRCRPLPLEATQRRQMSGALRSVPSPEHGTSHRILSYLKASPCNQTMQCQQIAALYDPFELRMPGCLHAISGLPQAGELANTMLCAEMLKVLLRYQRNL